MWRRGLLLRSGIAENKCARCGTSGSPSAAPFEFLSAPAWARLISAHFRLGSVRFFRFGEPQKILDDRFPGDFRPGREQGEGAHAGAPAVRVGIAIQNESLDRRQVSVTYGREDPCAILCDDIAADLERLLLRQRQPPNDM